MCQLLAWHCSRGSEPCSVWQRCFSIRLGTPHALFTAKAVQGCLPPCVPCYPPECFSCWGRCKVPWTAACAFLCSEAMLGEPHNSGTYPRSLAGQKSQPMQLAPCPVPMFHGSMSSPLQSQSWGSHHALPDFASHLDSKRLPHARLLSWRGGSLWCPKNSILAWKPFAPWVQAMVKSLGHHSWPQKEM